MKTLVLDGSSAGDAFADSVWAAIGGAGEAKGLVPDRLLLRDMKIAPCLGCFGCWIKTPGQCVIDDEGREVCRRIVGSELVIYSTPVAFGGYSGILKNALDRTIPNISPMFRYVKREVHHQKRYSKYPRLLAIGWLPVSELDQEDTFELLIQRNALNMHAPKASALVLQTSTQGDALSAAVDGALQEVIG